MRSKCLLSTVCFKTEVNFQTRSESVLEDHSGEKIGVIISTNNIESTVWGFVHFGCLCVYVRACVCLSSGACLCPSFTAVLISVLMSCAPECGSFQSTEEDMSSSSTGNRECLAVQTLLSGCCQHLLGDCQ